MQPDHGIVDERTCPFAQVVFHIGAALMRTGIMTSRTVRLLLYRHVYFIDRKVTGRHRRSVSSRFLDDLQTFIVGRVQSDGSHVRHLQFGSSVSQSHPDVQISSDADQRRKTHITPWVDSSIQSLLLELGRRVYSSCDLHEFVAQASNLFKAQDFAYAHWFA